MEKDVSFNINSVEISGSDRIDKQSTNFSTKKDNKFRMLSHDSPTLAESPKE